MADETWLKFDFYPAGAELIRQGTKPGSLIVLKEGEIEVLRDGKFVASTHQPGAIFGEMGVLLDRPASASVRALTDVQLYVIDDALTVLEQHPSWLLQIARLLGAARQCHHGPAGGAEAAGKRRGQFRYPRAPHQRLLHLGRPSDLSRP